MTTHYIPMTCYFCGKPPAPQGVYGWGGVPYWCQCPNTVPPAGRYPPQPRTWILAVEAEMARARKLHPSPDLLLTAFSEEAGEVVKAALDHYEGKGSVEEIRTELIQVAAMVGRLLEEGDPIHHIPATERIQ